MVFGFFKAKTLAIHSAISKGVLRESKQSQEIKTNSTAAVVEIPRTAATTSSPVPTTATPISLSVLHFVIQNVVQKPEYLMKLLEEVNASPGEKADVVEVVCDRLVERSYKLRRRAAIIVVKSGKPQKSHPCLSFGKRLAYSNKLCQTGKSKDCYPERRVVLNGTFRRD